MKRYTLGTQDKSAVKEMQLILKWFASDLLTDVERALVAVLWCP